MSICLSVCRHIVNRFLCIIMSGITKTKICNKILIPQAIAKYCQIHVKSDTKLQYALQNSNTFSFTHCEKIYGGKIQLYILKIGIESKIRG